jgi:hypothetical protein
MEQKRQALILQHNHLVQQAQEHEAMASAVKEQAIACRGKVGLLEELINAEPDNEGEQDCQEEEEPE